MTFEEVEMHVVLSMSGNMHQDIELVKNIIKPLNELYKEQNKVICLTYTPRDEYRISIEEDGCGSNRRTEIHFYRSIRVIWRVITKLVHKYSIKHSGTYYVEKYFDLSTTVDN